MFLCVKLKCRDLQCKIFNGFVNETRWENTHTHTHGGKSTIFRHPKWMLNRIKCLSSFWNVLCVWIQLIFFVTLKVHVIASFLSEFCTFLFENEAFKSYAVHSAHCTLTRKMTLHHRDFSLSWIVNKIVAVNAYKHLSNTNIYKMQFHGNSFVRMTDSFLWDRHTLTYSSTNFYGWRICNACICVDQLTTGLNGDNWISS